MLRSHLLCYVAVNLVLSSNPLPAINLCVREGWATQSSKGINVNELTVTNDFSEQRMQIRLSLFGECVHRRQMIHLYYLFVGILKSMWPILYCKLKWLYNCLMIHHTLWPAISFQKQCVGEEYGSVNAVYCAQIALSQSQTFSPSHTHTHTHTHAPWPMS